jgi:HAD superfamily hydrolase (TIGR01509 family)
MIQSLIFDFDGLILDTEWPDFQSWQEVYQEYGVELSLETWLPCVGSNRALSQFEPYAYLEAHTECALDREEIEVRRRRRHAELMEAQLVLPGVEALIAEAKLRRMALAVASSSSRRWVAGNLGRLGLIDYFDALVCGDEVARVKPYPEIYLTALEKLGVQASEAIALEDSLNGMLAAKRAGIFCVVVPNALTQHSPFEQVDLRLASLADLSLQELIERCN